MQGWCLGWVGAAQSLQPLCLLDLERYKFHFWGDLCTRKLKNWCCSRYFPPSAFGGDIGAVFSFVVVEIPSVWGFFFFSPRMTRVISTARLNCSGIKFQAEQLGSYFIISEFIPELGTNVFKFHSLVQLLEPGLACDRLSSSRNRFNLLIGGSRHRKVLRLGMSTSIFASLN